MSIDELDKRIIRLIQGDLPEDLRPFAILAEKLGITEEEFLARIKGLKKMGVIRRFGATLRHQEAGFNANAMIAWKVPEERINEVGKAVAKFREVTHCYHRRTEKDWVYNLYTMVHADSKEECQQVALKISDRIGITDYVLLFSQKEFKKTSMQYF